MQGRAFEYTKVMGSAIFVILLFLVAGSLSLSANIKSNDLQSIPVSDAFSTVKFNPSVELITNDISETIEVPAIILEQEEKERKALEEAEAKAKEEAEKAAEAAKRAEQNNIKRVDVIQAPTPINKSQVKYVGRIPYDYTQPVPVSEAADDYYFNDALFIGDSRTVGLLSYGGVKSFFYAKVALTIRGVFTNAFIEDSSSGENVTRTILDTVRIYPQFKKVYILFGLNEVGWDPKVFINTYSYVIDQFQEILPNAQIFIVEISPVSKKVSDLGTNGVRNETIDRFNKMLLQLAEEQEVFYLALGDVFRTKDGCIPDDVSWDGIHFNVESCKKQMNYIRNHVVDYDNVYLKPGETPVILVEEPIEEKVYDIEIGENENTETAPDEIKFNENENINESIGEAEGINENETHDDVENNQEYSDNIINNNSITGMRQRFKV